MILFQINTTIETIDLEGNSIEGDGAKYLSRMLRENLYITELVSKTLQTHKTCLYRQKYLSIYLLTLCVCSGGTQMDETCIFIY